MLNLTKQERQAILFLITIALVGLGVNFLLARYPFIKTVALFNQDIGKTDLNRADKDTLIGVCGIGEKLAQRIIEYRAQHGAFKNLEELKKIKGINGYRYEKIKDSLFIQ